MKSKCAGLQDGCILNTTCGRKKTLENMTKTLAKRGPDEENVWSETHVGFGHKRLTVVDPEGGRQPMTKNHERRQIYTLL